MSNHPNSPTYEEHMRMVQRMSASLQNMSASPNSPQSPSNKATKRSSNASPRASTQNRNPSNQYQNNNRANDSGMSPAQSSLSIPRQRPHANHGMQADGQQSASSPNSPFGNGPSIMTNLGFHSFAQPPSQTFNNNMWQTQQPPPGGLWERVNQQLPQYSQGNPTGQPRSFTDPVRRAISNPNANDYNDMQPSQTLANARQNIQNVQDVSRNFNQSMTQISHQNMKHQNVNQVPPRQSSSPLPRNSSNTTPRITSLTTNASSTTSLAGIKRRLPTPIPDLPQTAHIYLQNDAHPNGTTLSVALPPHLHHPYLPPLTPRHPNPTLTATTLRHLLPGIQIERYACALRCRNKGTCVHYHFLLGSRHTPDGLICRKCHEAGETVAWAKAKRKCVAHQDGVGPGSLACDYLATEGQRWRMVEVLERAWRGSWEGGVEEVRYALPREKVVGVLVEGVVASAGRVDAGAQDVGGARTHVGEQQVQQQAENDEKGKGKAVEGDGMAAKEEQQVPNSAPAAMQSFSDMNDLFGDYEMGHLSGWGI